MSIKISKAYFYLFVSIIMGISIRLNAQDLNGSLKIGEKVPDIDLGFMVNQPGGKANFADYRGKLIILDFWSRACIPCVQGMPKMEKLQEHFGDKIQIILVNVMDPLDEINRKHGGFPGRDPSPILQNTKLPFVFDRLSHSTDVCGGTLGKLFEHSGEPYHVWIDQKGKVVAKTSGVGTSLEKINDFLSGKSINLIEEHNLDEVYDYYGEGQMLPGAKQSLIRKENGWILDKIEFSSIFTRGLFAKGVGAGNIIDSATGKKIGFRRELTDLKHITLSFLQDAGFPENRMVFIGKRAEQLKEPADRYKLNDWLVARQHFYELRLPVSALDDDPIENEKYFQEIYKQDIARFLRVDVHLERRKVRCLLLVRTSTNNKLESKGDKELFEETKEEFTMVNYPFEAFITSLVCGNSHANMPYIIDSTGFRTTMKVNMKLNGELTNINSIKKQLKQYDLDLVEKWIEMDVLVIKDK